MINMKKILCFSILVLACFEVDAKIYDCFLFYNELEILTIRLHELYDHVDKFVLVEAEETFRGKPKPLYYQENKHLFERFEDKIIHVIIKGHYELSSGGMFEREFFQRNQILNGLTDCSDNDIIIISDVDEILRANAIREIQNMIASVPEKTPKWISCMQTCYSYFFNRYDFQHTPWRGSMAAPYEDIKKYSPQFFRNIRGNRPLLVKNAGWHLTSMGGFERFLDKLSAFSAIYWDTPEYNQWENLKKKIEAMTLVPIDETFPRLIYENQAEYIAKGFIDTV